MTITPPTATQLIAAPELAILAALELALVTSIEALAARYPVLRDDGPEGCDSNFSNDTALALDAQARTLVATINRYRLSLVDPGDSNF